MTPAALAEPHALAASPAPIPPQLLSPAIVEHPWASPSRVVRRGSLAAALLAELLPSARPAPPRRMPLARLAPDPARTSFVSAAATAWSDDPRELCSASRLAHAVATAPPRAGVRAAFPSSITVFTPADAQAWRDAGAQGVCVADAEALVARLLHRALEPLDAGLLDRAPGDALLVALGDHPLDLDARLLMYAASLVAVDGRSTILALPQGARDLPAARRYLRGFDLPLRLVEASGPLLPLLAAADACLLCARDSHRAGGIAGRAIVRACDPGDGDQGGTKLLAALARSLNVPVVPLPRTEPLRRDARRLVAPLFDALDTPR